MSCLRLNWLIYESDIVVLGGNVSFTGNMIKRSKRSLVEEAKVSLFNSEVYVYMERFKDGTSVICNFLDDAGKPVAKNSPNAVRFLNLYKAIRNQDELFQEFVFFRTTKQVFTLLMQILCVCTLIHSVCSVVSAVTPYTFIIEGVLSVIVFWICTRMYSHIRRECFANYISILNRLDE